MQPTKVSLGGRRAGKIGFRIDTDALKILKIWQSNPDLYF